MTAIQEQISEARELLNTAEKTVDPATKRALVESALELFEDCIDSQPMEREINLIKNIKISFARTLVDQIPKMNFKNEETLEFFLFVLLVKFCNETVELTNTDGGFKKKLLWIRDQYSEEFAYISRNA